MTRDRQNQISDLFHAVLKRTPEERSAFLKQACGGDEMLQREVESLLGYESAAASFLETPTAQTLAGIVAADRTLTADWQVGPYTIVAPLGVGGMGEVYRARDRKLGRDVAIKILPSHFASDRERHARLAREARLLATLNHPHIGAIYGLEESDGITALVLELVEGQTLAERLGRRPLSVGQALTIARQIAEALDAAHEKGIVHRDLKPANVVLQPLSGSTDDVRAKVLDFGLAKPMALSPDGDLPLGPLEDTEEGRILGTPAYMSPEQARGLTVDKRTDIWAFGCVLFEMLSGRRPFEGHTVTDTFVRILEHDPDWSALPTSIPVPIGKLLERCLRKDPRKRLHDIADALLELEDWQSASVATDETRRQHTASDAPARARRAGYADGTVPINDSPNLGRLVAKLCDRQAHEEEFRDRFLEALARFPGVPQMFVIPGEEGQCHESLVRRLVDRIDRSLVPGLDRGGGRVKKIAWQYDGVLAQRLSRQIYSLFEHFGSRGGRQPYHATDRSAVAFDALLAESLNAYLVIEHEVHGNRWDDTSADLLAAYRQYWSELPPSPDRQVLVLFISVIFPRPSESSWKKLVPGLDAAVLRRRKIQRGLSRLHQTAGIPCCVLAELPPVTREDVLEWFSLNHIYDSEERRMRALERLFPRGDMAPKAMWEIESFCGEELRVFAAERVSAETR